MPITRQLTQDELNELKAHGIDSSGYEGKEVTLYTPEERAARQQAQSTTQNDQSSITDAVGHTVKSRAGRMIGGGLGSIPGAMAGGEIGALGGPFAPVTVPLGALIGGLITGTGGGWAGNKIQEKVEGEDTAKRLNEEQAKLEEEHPWATSLTEGAGTMLTGGMRPGLGGVKKMIGSGLLNSGIGAGVNALQGGQLDAGQMARDFAVGSVFNTQTKWAGRITGHGEPTPEPTKSDDIKIPDAVTTPERTSPWNHQDEDGNHLIDDKGIHSVYGEKLNPKPNRADYGEDYAKYQQDATEHRRKNSLPVEDKRNALHSDYLANPTVSEPTEVQKYPVGSKLSFQWPEGGTTYGTVKGHTKEGYIEVTNVPHKNEADDGKIFVRPSQIIEEPLKMATTEDILGKAKEEVTQPNEVEDEVTKQREAAKQARLKKEQDYAKMQAELVSQKYQSEENPLKPITENQAKIIDPKTLLGDNLDRPNTPQTDEEGNKVSYTGAKTYQEALAELKTLPPGSPEFMKKWGEVESIKNSQAKGHVPLPNDGEGLAAHVATKHPEYKWLMDYLVGSGALKGVKVGTSSDRSHYQPAGNKVNINTAHTSTPEVITEELLHAATAKHISAAILNQEIEGTHEFVKDNKGQTYLNKVKALAQHSQNKGIRSLADAYLQYHTNKGHVDIHGNTEFPHGDADEFGLSTEHGNGYYSGDLKEFVAAAFHNKGMRAELESIADKNSNTKQTLWGKFKDAIKSLFGMDVKSGTLLEKVLDSGKSLIDETGKSNSEGKEVKGDGSESFAKPDDEPHIKGYVANIDNIRKLSHPSAPHLADSFQQALQRNDENVGHSWNKVAEAAEKAGLTKADMTKIDAALDYERLHKSPAPMTMLNRGQRAVYQAFRDAYDWSGKRNIADKVPVYVNGTPRLLSQDPFSSPTPIKSEVAKTIRENVDSASIKTLNKQYMDNAQRLGYTLHQATEGLGRIHEQLQGKSSTGSSSTPVFAGSRLPKGIPLPKEWTGNFMQRTEAYFRRNAMDNAFYKHVESDPKSWAALGNAKDAWGKDIPADPNGSLQNNSHVKSQLEEFNGGKTGSAMERSLSSLATRAMIANPGIELHKIGGNEIGLFSLVDNPRQFASALKGSLNALTSGLQHAKENGTIKYTARSMSDVLDKNITLIDRLKLLPQTLSIGLQKVATLNDFTSRFSTGLLQAGCESILPDKIRLANGGNKATQMFMKRLDPTYTSGKSYTPEDISKLGSAMAGFIHGTHDGRTMPMWMQGEGELSGFAQLAHWSVAQTSRFMNDIVNQAKVGNYKPLVLSTLGSVLGGVVIRSLREKLQGKDGQIPSLKEIMSSSNPKSGLIAYNLVSAAQYAGFAGLASTAIRGAFDLRYKNHPQGATFPLDEIATDVLNRVGQFTTAMANDPTFDYSKASMKLAYDVLAHNVQLAKIGINQGINNGLITGEPAEKKNLSDKLNQLRRFDMVQGLPYQEPEPSSSNPYMDMESKRFRNTQDIHEAASKIEPLIKKWMEASKDNPDVIFSKLKGLKNAKYDTMPSEESEPLEFQRFYNFLKSTKGDAYASQYLEDYMRHKMINEAKGGMVP